MRDYEDFPEAPTTFRKALLWGGVALVVVIIIGGIFLVRQSQSGESFSETIEGYVPDFRLTKTLREKADYAPVDERKTLDSAPHATPQTALPTQTPAARAVAARQTQTPVETKRKRAPLHYVAHERKAEDRSAGDYTLLPQWIPCLLEPTLNSEIEGKFTVKTKRPTMDSTGRVVLIPNGQLVIAEDESAQLLVGNERIPTFALGLTLPDGTPLDLGRAPIMDATGTNGLTGEVDNHTWRLVWTSVFMGGLEGGQQVLQQELSGNSAGAVASGVARQMSSASQRRLGRAQDTRPTILVASGDLCNILITKPRQLAAVR